MVSYWRMLSKRSYSACGSAVGCFVSTIKRSPLLCQTCFWRNIAREVPLVKERPRSGVERESRRELASIGELRERAEGPGHGASPFAVDEYVTAAIEHTRG